MNIIRYLHHNQHYNKQIDGGIILLTAIHMGLKLGVIHPQGVWEPWGKATDVYLLYMGNKKFRLTAVGTLKIFIAFHL